MAYSLWEFLRFTDEELEQRLRTMTYQEREAERLEALREFEASRPRKEKKNGLSR